MTKYEVLPEIRSLVGQLDEESRDHLLSEIGTNLDERSQQSLLQVVCSVLTDELAFLIEVEIRRQSARNMKDGNNAMN